MTEDRNPYEAPRADIGQVPASSSSRTGWKVYAYGVALLQIGGLYFALRKIRLTEVLDYAVTAVGMIGLFGYAYRRALWKRRIWMSWAALFPIWDVVMGALVYPRQNGTEVRMGYFVAMLMILPQYWALIRYAYRSPELWPEATSLDRLEEG